MSGSKVPAGYPVDQIRLLAHHYGNQSVAEAEAEIDAAFEDPQTVFIQVPLDLAPRVEALIAGSKKPATYSGS